MKRFLCIISVLAILASICNVSVLAADTIEDPTQNVSIGLMDSDVTPREIISHTYTKTVALSGHPTHAVTITLSYTTRYEASNSSKAYITGVTSGSASLPWYSTYSKVGSVSIGTVTYSNNHQTAIVPVTYQVSEGDGWQSHSTHITISLT